MTKPTELTTERLLLRPFRMSDVDDVLAYGSDPGWAEFPLHPYDRGVAEHRVARITGGLSGTRQPNSPSSPTGAWWALSP